MQDEIRKNTRDGSSSKIDDEEKCALAIKARKGKGKIYHSKSDSYHGGKKNDTMKVKCFHCHEWGHFVYSRIPRRSPQEDRWVRLWPLNSN